LAQTDLRIRFIGILAKKGWQVRTMRILKSRNNRSRLGQQLVAGCFALAVAGSPFYQNLAIADISPGCQKEYEELGKQCVTAIAANDAVGQAGVAGATSSGGCPAGQSLGYPTTGFKDGGLVCQPTVNLAAGQAQTSALIAKNANANVSASCAKTLKECEQICTQAIQRHNKSASLAASTQNEVEAKRQEGLSANAKTNAERCQTQMGTVVAETGISATTLGIAAAAAGGIFLLTKSGKKSGDSSGDDTTTPDDPTAVDPITTDPDSGFQTYDKMVEYWTTNHCVAVLSNKISASEDIKSNCSVISKDPSFSSSLASLGTCSDVDNYGRPDCFDRLNNYCLQVTETSRSSDPTCAGFCVSKPEADSCKYVVGYMTPGGVPIIQPIDQNATPDQTSSSGSPFNTGTPGTSYYPRVQQTASGTPGYVSSSTRGTSRYVSSSQSQTGSSLSPRIAVPASGTRTLASAGQPDCSSSQMMNKPECEAPMTKYCSQYGSQGKGCADFCKTHKGVCKK
jgi:hypothetical protein